MATHLSRSDPLALMLQAPPIRMLMAELATGLTRYWEAAGRILQPCGVTLKAPPEKAFSLQKNFFSLLFLYSYYRAGIPPQRRILYAATLQCLRGMVTGCDNLLDDEYKPTLDTDLPAAGYRFRSVVDIMVSDRVLFQVLMQAALQAEIAIDQVREAAAASMQTMTRSGAEEASEEAGIAEILPPKAILETIHHLKTGILFQCPWDIPLTIESVAEADLQPLLEGLYRIGMGCQIMDDMVDMPADISARRHNYLVSLVFYGEDPVERRRLDRLMHPISPPERRPAIDLFPRAMHQAIERADRLLIDGLSALFAAEDHPLVMPAVRFLKRRIGVPERIEQADA